MEERRFENWLSNLYFKEKGKLLSDEDLKKIVRILEAKADFDENISRHTLDVRVRGYGGNNGNEDRKSNNKNHNYEDETENFTEIYYDLTNRNWEAIKITAEDWTIVKDPPILFKRYGSESPQVYPNRDYENDILDQYIELQNI